MLPNLNSMFATVSVKSRKSGVVAQIVVTIS